MTKKVVLFIHGFSAKKEDNLAFLEEMNHRKKIEMHTFILPGHETKRMGKVKYQDWLDASEKELQKLLKNHSQITIVGHSMGTIIALYLAAHYPQVEKLVLISPAYYFGNLEQNKKDMYRLFRRKIDPNIGTGFEGFFQKLWTVPFSRFLEYRKLVKNTEDSISEIQCPTLLLHGTEDNVVPIRSSLYVYNALTCEKHLTFIEDTRHQVFKSQKAKAISTYIYEYIMGGILFKMNQKDIL